MPSEQKKGKVELARHLRSTIPMRTWLLCQMAMKRGSERTGALWVLLQQSLSRLDGAKSEQNTRLKHRAR
eukprot:2834317-Rhodomonas_salina.1